MAQSLKNRWLNHLLSLDVDLNAAKATFSEIETAYSEDTRAYHTLNHLEEMFALFDAYKDRLDSPGAVALAIFLHDLVYDTQNPNNEEGSATLARDILNGLGVRGDMVESVCEMIMATKSHRCDDPNSDTACMLDIDMAILASTPDRYREYCDQIRKEWPWLSDQEFYAGRKTRFVEPCLKADRLFMTATFHEKYDDVARSNLKAELKSIDARLKLAKPKAPKL